MDGAGGRKEIGRLDVSDTSESERDMVWPRCNRVVPRLNYLSFRPSEKRKLADSPLSRSRVSLGWQIKAVSACSI